LGVGRSLLGPPPSTLMCIAYRKITYRKIVEAMISGPETGMAVQLRPTASLVLSIGLGGLQITAGPSKKHTHVSMS
jgi:hypothetical protein